MHLRGGTVIRTSFDWGAWAPNRLSVHPSLSRGMQGAPPVGNRELMCIILEYATFVVLTLVFGALLLGVCIGFIVIEEGVQLVEVFVRALVRSGAPIMRPVTHLTVHGG